MFQVTNYRNYSVTRSERGLRCRSVSSNRWQCWRERNVWWLGKRSTCPRRQYKNCKTFTNTANPAAGEWILLTFEFSFTWKYFPTLSTATKKTQQMDFFTFFYSVWTFRQSTRLTEMTGHSMLDSMMKRDSMNRKHQHRNREDEDPIPKSTWVVWNFIRVWNLLISFDKLVVH